MAGDLKCDDVRAAAMAKLDRELAPLEEDECSAHVAGCGQCRDAIDSMKRLHAGLDALHYEPAAKDLWPAIHARIVPRRDRPRARERRAFEGLAALVLGWRAAQLMFDVPVPVLNAAVPLAVVILILWWVAGDPLAIQTVMLDEQQERA
jgi:hypothetical protein